MNYQLGFILHLFFLIISLCIILTVIYLVFTNFYQFKNLDYYKKIVFLASLAIAISSHELVKYNFIKTFGFNPTYI